MVLNINEDTHCFCYRSLIVSHFNVHAIPITTERQTLSEGMRLPCQCTELAVIFVATQDACGCLHTVGFDPGSLGGGRLCRRTPECRGAACRRGGVKDAVATGWVSRKIRLKMHCLHFNQDLMRFLARFDDSRSRDQWWLSQPHLTRHKYTKRVYLVSESVFPKYGTL